MDVEIDLKANGAVYAGTFSQPVQGIKGLPLSTVVVEGKNVRFVVRAGQAPATFQGLFPTTAHRCPVKWSKEGKAYRSS